MQKTRAIWWVKRDFCLFDNAALCRALTECSEVIPLFVFEPLVFGGPDWGIPHTQAVHQGVLSLRKNLQHYQSELVVRRGKMVSVLEELLREVPFTHMYAHEETGLQHTYERDKAVARWCRERGILFIEVPTNGAVRGLQNRDHRHTLFSTEMEAPLLPVPKRQLMCSFPIGVPPGRMPSTNKIS